eukprot:3806445-Karenia_brevis.AAC.1
MLVQVFQKQVGSFACQYATWRKGLSEDPCGQSHVGPETDAGNAQGLPPWSHQGPPSCRCPIMAELPGNGSPLAFFAHLGLH